MSLAAVGVRKFNLDNESIVQKLEEDPNLVPFSISGIRFERSFIFISSVVRTLSSGVYQTHPQEIFHDPKITLQYLSGNIPECIQCVAITPATRGRVTSEMFAEKIKIDHMGNLSKPLRLDFAAAHIFIGEDTKLTFVFYYPDGRRVSINITCDAPIVYFYLGYRPWTCECNDFLPCWEHTDV